MPPTQIPGDDLVAEANLVFDRRWVLNAAPEQIWPWLAQLGKRRAGWYLPRHVERLLPPRRRASRVILAEHQHLEPGRRIPDYGGPEEWLEVAHVDPPWALVYRTERRGTPFSWALLLTPRDPGGTELRLRFRARLKSTGPRRRAIVAFAALADGATSRLMVSGLRERLGECEQRGV